MAPPIVSPRTYLKTFVALLILLGLTMAANFLNLGALSVAVALSISVAKAALIGLFFMEIRYSKPIVWLFAGAALAWLMIMLTLTINDYNTRPWSHQAWKADAGRPMHILFKK